MVNDSQYKTFGSRSHDPGQIYKQEGAGYYDHHCDSRGGTLVLNDTSVF